MSHHITMFNCYHRFLRILSNKGKCIVPKFNLVSNIGFGDDATHTFDAESEDANRKRYEINIPLNFAFNSETEKEINKFYDRNEFSRKPNIIRIINKFTRLTIRKNILK